MKTIILAEKPSVGKEIARVLGCHKKNKAFMESSNYIVTWAMGHLVELADPGSYHPDWKTWAMDYLPMLPEKMKHKVIRRTSHQFNAIKGLFKRQDVNNLIIATDAGREGELVARWIMRLGGWKKPFQRLWISSQTDTAIKEGFKNLKPGKNYDNLLRAAEARSEADWIVGLNVTRALTCKYDSRLSAGRVQTPTLAMIIQREEEIKKFIPQPYWTIVADFGKFNGTWHSPKGHSRVQDQEFAQKIVAKVKDQQGEVTSLDIKEKREVPPLAYDLTALQRDANALLGFSAKKTLQTLQRLYEHHKMVTYPRTDSRYITSDMVPTLKDRLQALNNTPYQQFAQKIIQSGIKPGKRLVDDKKVTDHHAIIPTEEKVYLDKLNPEERKLWELIARRFLATLSSDHIYKTIQIIVTVNGEPFHARGKQTITPGWRAISSGEVIQEENEDLPFQNLSQINKGDVFQVVKVTTPQGMTKPPARYTEGTLLAAMENAGKFIDDKMLKSSIEKGGLGTPATRADIIEKLFSNYYIERQGKELVPTSQGFELITLVPKSLKSPELTARWELRLNKISEGTEKNQLFLKDIRDNTKELIVQIQKSTQEFKPQNSGESSCPLCGKKLLATRNKKGKKILVCRSRSCGYESESTHDGSYQGKQSKKEQQISRKLIHKYTDSNAKETFTLGDILKKSLDKDK
ncbi:MAG: DNA topoisomerase III [Spirochaetes bacterium]|nr:DNA topoisomerase III [Spirochaetota bacterium]